MPARKRKLLSPDPVSEPSEPEPRRALQQTRPEESGRIAGTDREELRSVYFPIKPEPAAETGPKTGPEPGGRLGFTFFNQPCVDLARAFLGKVLVRTQADGTELRGRVVETEAYLGGEDRASHSAGGKRTERNVAMFMKPGTIYVYPIYGIYLCMNVSSQGEGAAVLLRALEPLQGQNVMRKLREAKRREGAKTLRDRELCNGPSKLCQALDIQRRFDRRDLATDAQVWLEDSETPGTPGTGVVVSAPRIGIDSHGEWATKPLRFYLHRNTCVSVVNRDAENRLQVTDRCAQNRTGTQTAGHLKPS
ncbi:DNA-3-methyladenine glycosylase [Astyanax mexicanus]|uniref:DNA-3-methyladenine glycosylase n=1 Tax=Astyanax mexicanus TaxID=7994 RepID=UPI0020CB15B6|nr:DNA-3-methyladenine glycosylase [Astyanax mexicanus]